MTRVEEPSKYGVVVYKPENGQIESFVEKPQEYVSNKINAGNLFLLSAIQKPFVLLPELARAIATTGNTFKVEAA